MKHLESFAAAAAVCFAAAALPALASESASSAASSGSSASVGSVSDSFRASSDGSSKTTTAEGDYKVIEVAAVADRPGTSRLRLQAEAGRTADEVLLDLPAQTVERSGIAVGQTVTVQARPYGMEFSRGDTRQAFFLVLDDTWYRELRSNVVAL